MKSFTLGEYKEVMELKNEFEEAKKIMRVYKKIYESAISEFVN